MVTEVETITLSGYDNYTIRKISIGELYDPLYVLQDVQRFCGESSSGFSTANKHCSEYLTKALIPSKSPRYMTLISLPGLDELSYIKRNPKFDTLWNLLMDLNEKEDKPWENDCSPNASIENVSEPKENSFSKGQVNWSIITSIKNHFQDIPEDQFEIQYNLSKSNLSINISYL
jgi:hypothetical protein